MAAITQLGPLGLPMRRYGDFSRGALGPSGPPGALDLYPARATHALYPDRGTLTTYPDRRTRTVYPHPEGRA